MPKVCEMIRNTPKYRFWSNKLDWMRSWQNYSGCSTPQNFAFSLKTQVFHDLSCRKFAKWSKTLQKHRFGSNRLDWMRLWQNFFRKFDTSKFYIQPQNTSFSWFVLPKVWEMIRNTQKHRFGSNRLDWMCSWQNFSGCSTPQNFTFSLKTQVFHDLSCRRFAKWSETLPNIDLDLTG